MDLEKLIDDHNQWLEESTGDVILLEKRLRARVREKKASNSQSLVVRFRKWVVVYSLVFLLLVLFNFKLINWLSEHKSPKIHVISMTENPFQPVFPGSISQAYLEVTQWSE